MRPSLPHNNHELIWSSWDVPNDSVQPAFNRHRIGDTTIFTRLDHAGEGAVLSMYSPQTIIDNPAYSQVARPACDDPQCPPEAEEAGWIHSYLGKQTRYRLLPAYPDLPLCIRLKPAFILPPLSTVQGWLYSYINAEIHIGEHRAASFPLRPLYKTLYGTTTAGVVCFAIDGKFLAEDEPDYLAAEGDPSCIAHPVRIRNNTAEAVTIQDLCVYGSQLSIFQRHRHLFSEKILFSFGPQRVKMSIEGQKRGSDVLTLAQPQVTGEDKVIERSLEIFKAITRM